MQPGSSSTPAQPALGRGARIIGWSCFAAFELIVLLLVWIVASFRCCTAGTGAAPQSAAEWIALGIFAVVMLLLGVAIGLGAAFSAEGLRRLFRRTTRRRENAP